MIGSVPKARRCIFCGQTLHDQKSREHIFPRWLQEHLGLANKHTTTKVYAPSGEAAFERRFVFNGHVTGLVCMRCNSGWLSDLEARARPALVPLVDATLSGTISAADCNSIAVWSFKTALTLHSAALLERFVPAHHYRTLFESKIIPQGVQVSIAQLRDNGGLSWIQHQNWPGMATNKSPEDCRSEFKQTYRIIFSAGYLAVRVHYWNLQSLHLFEYASNRIGRIYPVDQKGVSWPLEPMLDIQELDESLIIA